MGTDIVTKQRLHRKQKLVYGIGINDADYCVATRQKGKQWLCPFYQTWRNMLCRCYCTARLTKRPSYENCTVAEEWYLFSNFRKWMETQPWEGRQLDKDFLTASHVYSSDTCVFIPSWLNCLFWRSERKQRELPDGVTRRVDGIYKAQIGSRQTCRHLGSFATPEAAHAAYVTAKTDYVRSRYPEIALIDPRLVEACERRLKECTECITPSPDCANTP